MTAGVVAVAPARRRRLRALRSDRFVASGMPVGAVMRRVRRGCRGWHRSGSQYVAAGAAARYCARSSASA
ncbi:hypothetical protein WJ03_30030 [Burkholderia vietnamiensis]|nr:hypothetical protein WJ03_30030 [Burkholderia vietnamiensis]